MQKQPKAGEMQSQGRYLKLLQMSVEIYPESKFRIWLCKITCICLICYCSSRKVEEDEYEDGTTNQKWVLAPKTQDTDVTLILNKLLREYDKKLRPDIGSKYSFLHK